MTDDAKAQVQLLELRDELVARLARKLYRTSLGDGEITVYAIGDFDEEDFAFVYEDTAETLEVIANRRGFSVKEENGDRPKQLWWTIKRRT